MKKKNWKRRTIILLLLTPIILILAYQAIGCPVLTAEQGFHRAAKEHALGTTSILGTESIITNDYGYQYDTLIVAETNYGAILYCTKRNTYEQLYYREKNNSLTVMALPNGGWSWEIDQPRQLNVILFDDYPEAVRAELDITVDWPYDFYGFTTDGVFYHYQLNAERNAEGYFRFVHTIYGSDYMDNDNVAMRILTDISCKRQVNESYFLELEIPVTVRLYDSDGQIVTEQSFYIRSIGAEEHDKHST